MFETHQPEIVPLHARPVKRGERVARRTGNLAETFRVRAIRDGVAECVKDADATQNETIPAEQLVVVRRVVNRFFRR